jgi:hypothetical protein
MPVMSSIAISNPINGIRPGRDMEGQCNEFILTGGTPLKRVVVKQAD